MIWVLRRLVAVLAFAAVVAGTAGAWTSLVVRSDEWIGTFAVKKDGTLGGLEKAFGKPATLVRGKDGCRASWNIGLNVKLYNLAGKNPCKPATGYFSDAIMYGTGWSTDRGLRIGATTARLKALYPKAKRHGNFYWLVPRFTQATGSYPGLGAFVLDGKVNSLQVVYGAGGE
jgi:hypothetical protein